MHKLWQLICLIIWDVADIEDLALLIRTLTIKSMILLPMI